MLYANQNQLDKARTALEMAIRTNPSYATAHENLGDIYAKLASQAYNKALQLDAANATSVKPKLALIRELFSADIARVPSPLRGSPAPAVVATQRPAPAPAPAAAPPHTGPCRHSGCTGCHTSPRHPPRQTQPSKSREGCQGSHRSRASLGCRLGRQRHEGLPGRIRQRL